MITFEHVSKAYENGTPALRDITFSIEDHEFVFLVGPSGSGKTTILKLITGEIAGTDGTILVNGYDMNRVTKRQKPKLRRSMGIVFQDFRLIEDKDAYQNVAVAMHVAGASRKEIADRVPYVLELVGLKDRMHDFPNRMSGGEQQRVAIARALANNPKLLIADEPTGNIDPEKSLDLMTLLDHINESGTTMLVVTHEAELVNRFAKRVIRIENGAVTRDSKGWYRE